MNFLIFDTETNKFPDKNLPFHHQDQAHIVQLACLLLDENFNEITCFNSLIRPDRFISIEDGAYNAHMISIENCQSFGVNINTALQIFAELQGIADLQIAHNIKFDSHMMSIEFDFDMRLDKNQYCTMEAMTPIMKLPSKIPGKYKWPKLQEAYRFIHGKEFEDAHDALADVRATAKIFRWLVMNGYYKIESKDNLKETLA